MTTSPFSYERLRAMYPGGRANPAARRLARFWASTFRLGLLPRRWVVLEVAGRRSGRLVRFPLGMADLGGQWYLVSMLGEDCNWVQNMRAADGRVTLRRRHAMQGRLIEVPPGERALVIKRYLEKVPGARPHIPVGRRAPLTDFEAIAARYPLFRVVRLDAIDRLPPAPGARPRTRPRPGKRLPGSRIADALLPRLQPAAARRIVGTAATGTFTDITRARHNLVVTYRRDGSAVPTTVWAAPGEGCLYVRTERASGKVLRIRRDPRALIAAATARGRPLSPPMAVTARVLEASEEATAEAALATAHGWYRALFENRADRLRVDMCYLELKPAPPAGQAGR